MPPIVSVDTILGTDVILVTGIGATITGIAAATLEPSVAVIIILTGPPIPTPVTKPVDDTLAILVLEDE